MATPAHDSPGRRLSGPQVVSPPPSLEPPVQGVRDPGKGIPPRWPVVVMTAAGSLSLLLGLLVMAGWHTGHILLPPALLIQGELVRYNTGLCFALGGLALLLLARENLAGARICGLLIAMVGLLTSCEYIFGLNLGIDELLFSGRQPAPAVPLRMAPNTAASFFLLGGALLLTTAEREGCAMPCRHSWPGWWQPWAW